MCSLKQKQIQNQYAIIVDGKFPFNQQSICEKFTKDVYSTVLAGFNRKTATVQLECAVNVGDKFKDITEIVDINTMNEGSITPKNG